MKINTTVVEDIMNDSPKSWNSAALQAVTAIIALNYTVANKLQDMRKHLDMMITQGMRPGADNNSDVSQFYDFWRILGAMTRSSAESLNIGFFGNLDGSNLITEITQILIKKQTDYGHDNISRFGRIGLLVRVHDKVARLENLTARNLNPANESLSDNYIDVIGYSAIGMMVESGTFGLELEK
jgi:hypothetical protein